MSERLLDFARGLLEGSGCLAEPRGAGLLDVVLTSEVAAALDVPESSMLSFAPGGATEGARAVVAGGDILDRLGALLGERGRSSEIWTGPVYLKREGLVQRAAERLSSSNTSIRAGEPVDSIVSWLRASYRSTAVSEEKREGTIDVVLNERTGAVVPGLLSLWDDAPVGEGPPPPVERLSCAALLRRIRALTEAKARADIEPFRKGLERRLDRDARRARDYYDGVGGEILKKIQRRRLWGEEQKPELERIRATEAERDRKLASLADRYSVRIRLTPISVERLVAPATLVPFTVHRKEKRRELALVWNPILKEIEPLACEACGESLWSFAACNAAVHILCQPCASRGSEGAKVGCAACQSENLR